MRLFANNARRLRRFDATRMSLKGYANLVAANTITTTFTHEYAQKRHPGGDLRPLCAAGDHHRGVSQESLTMERQHLDHLWRYLNEVLPNVGRQVLTALFVDALTPAETALQLGMKRGTVDSWRHRIKKHALRWRDDARPDAT